MSTVDQISRGRVGFLILNGLAFAAWQATEIGRVREAFDGPMLSIVNGSALALWTFTLVAVLVPFFTRPKIEVEDELTRQNRHKAFIWGYWVTIASAIIALFVASNLAVPPDDLLRLVLVIGVAAPILRFAIMEGSMADGE